MQTGHTTDVADSTRKAKEKRKRDEILGRHPQPQGTKKGFAPQPESTLAATFEEKYIGGEPYEGIQMPARRAHAEEKDAVQRSGNM